MKDGLENSGRPSRRKSTMIQGETNLNDLISSLEISAKNSIQEIDGDKKIEANNGGDIDM